MKRWVRELVLVRESVRPWIGLVHDKHENSEQTSCSALLTLVPISDHISYYT